MAFPISDKKLLHMRSVAELMYERALEWTGDEEYAEEMYVLGLLHDVGYILGSDSHGAKGADILERGNYSHADAVRFHGKADVADEELTREVILLQWCDMSVLPGGRKVPVAERLEDVGARYGFDSGTYADSKAIAGRLAKHGLF